MAQRHAEQARLTHVYLLFSGKTDLKDPVHEDLSSLSHLWNVPNDLLNVSTTRGWSFEVDCLHVYSLLSDDPHGFFSGARFDDEDVNEHHLRTDFRSTRSSAQLRQHKVFSPVPQSIAVLTHRQLWEGQMMTTSLKVKASRNGFESER